MPHRQADSQTDLQSTRQPDRRTDRRMDKQKDRQPTPDDTQLFISFSSAYFPPQSQLLSAVVNQISQWMSMDIIIIINQGTNARRCPMPFSLFDAIFVSPKQRGIVLVLMHNTSLLYCP